jgi:hypothetical protein
VSDTQRINALAAQALRGALAGVAAGEAIPDSEAFRDLQGALERLIPSLLGWRYESLDGFRFAVAKRVGPQDAEFLGLCLLMSDQSWTPIRLRVRVAPDSDAMQVVECKLGEAQDVAGGMVRLPYDSSRVTKALLSLPARHDSISWVHEVTENRAVERH